MSEPKELLTYSALNTFRNCPRKYKHRYVDALRPREKSQALAVGSVIHDALELWYLSVGKPNRLEVVLEALCEKGCRHVWQDIDVLERGEDLPETQGLGAEERSFLLRELKQVMAVYADRCSKD